MPPSLTPKPLKTLMVDGGLTALGGQHALPGGAWRGGSEALDLGVGVATFHHGQLPDCPCLSTLMPCGGWLVALRDHVTTMPK